jgi:predicted aconitase
LEAVFRGAAPPTAQAFDERALADTYASLSEHTGSEIDTVILGCPHASLREIAQIAALLDGKRIADGVSLWVSTARGTQRNAAYLGYVSTIEAAGGRVLCDTCPTNMRLPAHRIVMPGFKQAHYARGMTSVERLGGAGCDPGAVDASTEVIVADTPACIRAAIEGRWVGHV